MLEAYEGMENIHFVLKANSITSGVEEDIRDYLTLHPNIKLVVIDTLQHIRGNEFVKNIYAGDVEFTNILHQISMEFDLTILALTHTNKGKHDDDIFSNTIKEKDFIALERNIEIEDFYGISGDIYSDFYNCCFFKRFIVKNSQATNFIPEYTEVNKAKIYHGDARDVLRSFLESSIDAAVTSPPYYNAKEYSQWPNIYWAIANILLHCSKGEM